jgi:uncharacterized membrane protein required for colicin V production
MPPELIQFIKDLHVVDIILFLIIVGFAFLGFTKGTVKLFIILASIYLGFIIAAIYYLPVADLVHNLFNISLSKVAQIIAFLLINVVVALVLSILLFQFFGHIEIEGRAGACIDRPIGMLLGFLTGILFTAILVILLEVPYNLYEDLRLAGDQAPLLGILHDWFSNSLLAPVLINGLPILMGSISPLLNGHEPPILIKPTSEALPFFIGLVNSRLG